MGSTRFSYYADLQLLTRQLLWRPEISFQHYEHHDEILCCWTVILSTAKDLFHCLYIGRKTLGTPKLAYNA